MSRTMCLLLIIFLHSSYSYDDDNQNVIPGSKGHVSEEYQDVRGLRQKVEAAKHSRRHKTKHDPVEVPSSRLQLFEQTDFDGDGFVTRNEYASFNNLQDNDTTDIEDLFMTYDRDNDGQLSEQEFVEQSSPWEIVTECEFVVMQRCNAKLDETMEATDNEVEEPICRGLQAYLDCITTGQDHSGDSCDMESYVTSIKQTALVLHSSGLCPNLDIGKSDFEVEIDYEPNDGDIDPESDDYDDDDEEEDEEDEYSSDSVSSSAIRPGGRFIRDAAEGPSPEEFDILDPPPAADANRRCTTSSLRPCLEQFGRTTVNSDITSNLEACRLCILEKIDSCGSDKQKLLLRESWRIVAKWQAGEMDTDVY